jgi:uncharacterized membrane-anchored protein YitT (DUF2179 family)
MRDRFKQFRDILFNIVLIAAGSALCAMAVNGILVPHKFFGAGFTGISLIIHYIFPFLPVSLVYFIINIPVFSLGWMSVGRRFFLYHWFILSLIFLFSLLAG